MQHGGCALKASPDSTGRHALRLRIPQRVELLRSPLFSQRLVIEPLDSGCASRFFRSVQESRTSLEQWLPWVAHVQDLEGCRRYVDASILDWNGGNALRFALRPRGDASFLGVVSLENLNQAHRSADLGYWLHVDWTGKGLMREGLIRIVDFAFSSLCLHRIRVAAALENSKSRRLIERLGFVEEGVSRQAERVQGRWLTHANYSLLVTDPLPSGSERPSR